MPLPLPPSLPTLLMDFSTNAEKKKREKKNKYKAWLIFLNISLDFFMKETGAPMQWIEFRAK